MNNKTLRSVLLFICCVSICFIAAGVGSFFTFPSIGSWYQTLAKPSFTPPNWVFGPVWSILYFLMGVSLYLVLQVKKNAPAKQTALWFFFIQLFFNSMWSLVFFGLHAPSAGLFVIALLWLSIFFTIKFFLRISATAAYLLVPYLAWVTFASMLNIGIVVLN